MTGSDPSIAVQMRKVIPLISALVMLDMAVLENPSPAKAVEATLKQSQELLRQFPFQPNCNGNTQEMVACLWQRRNQADQALQTMIGDAERLERWRSGRRQACEVAAEKAKGGSVHPIVWLSCENALNKELLRQLRRPLLQSADL
jgi:uncharacterized protein YecT (DUF1311 family)